MATCGWPVPEKGPAEFPKEPPGKGARRRRDLPMNARWIREPFHAMALALLVLWGCTPGTNPQEAMAAAPAAAAGASATKIPCGPAPKYLILLLGDGMGAAQEEAGSLFLTGAPGNLPFERLPGRSKMATAAADSPITDSAASATAMATGKKVAKGVLSIRVPGDGSALPTLLEKAQRQGKAAGLVTTTFATHATPAAFAAHQGSRHSYPAIFQDYLKTRPALVLGGGGKESAIDPAQVAASGYTVVQDRASLAALSPPFPPKVWGIFGADHMPYEMDGTGSLPHLSEMVAKAIEILEKDTDGFFLLVEGGRIDHASHKNDMARLVREMAEFSKAVGIILGWAAARPEALVIVTADHETGGLTIVRGGKPGETPIVAWSTDEHTGAPVNLYAKGPGSELVRGTLDNTDVFRLAGGCAAGARP